MLVKTPRVVIAGLRGGSGKTTLSIGIVRALRNRGLRVSPFKKGPDYIDAGWLARAAGNTCRNLDAYLMSKDNIARSFSYGAQNAHIAVVEGNRGLFDGMDVDGSFSTSSLARILNAPVIIVIDCSKVTRTVAAILKGVAEFEEGLQIGGVILNRIGGIRHERMVRGAIEKYTSIDVIGAIGKLGEDVIPERHLGLVTVSESEEIEKTIDGLSKAVEGGLDLDRLINVSGRCEAVHVSPERQTESGEAVRIGVVMDRAFQFYYPENIEYLEQGGAEIVYLNALEADAPGDIDLLYIGGGFPETNAPAISRNEKFMQAVREMAERGLPVYAECGGLMYLGREIEMGGRVYPMTGILPLSFRMEGRPVAHGYTEVEVISDTPYFERGTRLKGHEFHYSRPLVDEGSINLVFSMRRGKGIINGMDGICAGNVFATYTHLHALGSPEWARGVLRVARSYKRSKHEV